LWFKLTNVHRAEFGPLLKQSDSEFRIFGISYIVHLGIAFLYAEHLVNRVGCG